jgi:hypothetical protein
MRVAYDAQLTETPSLSKRTKKVFHAGRPHSEAKVFVRVWDPENWMNITLS